MMNSHNFHIPVMGIGYTVDTPVRVAHLGIDSVVSLVDDFLLEKMRKVYCGRLGIPYTEINEKFEDFRAKRITSYLNLLNSLAEKKYLELKTLASGKLDEIRSYFGMLPTQSPFRIEFKKMQTGYPDLQEIRNWIKDKLSIGSIDVNIMTKVDKENYHKGKKLASEYNDAHAAVRGYANSDLSSSLVLSAGMNPRLYSYLENFSDFHPGNDWSIKKKIVLKVSDFKSALIQGKFLAKKGLWVSEFRVESGLNCGGHAFATDGQLLGPILEKFRSLRQELIQSIHDVFCNTMKSKERTPPVQPLPVKFTAQGGVGTADEHQFLLDHYKLDSIGWGSPFLLVPEVTNVDKATLEKLQAADEDSLYLSNISPLGIPFNSMRGNSKDMEKQAAISRGKPGSNCPRKYVALNKEFSEKGICAASRQFQRMKLKELDEEFHSVARYQERYDNIVSKSCICVGLGTAALLLNNIDTKAEGSGVSVCPGPNLAYFSKTMTLKEITDHIYGRANMISRTDRPHMFIKELSINLNFLKNRIIESGASITEKDKQQLLNFGNNVNDSINYYSELFTGLKNMPENSKTIILEQLSEGRKKLRLLSAQLNKDILSSMIAGKTPFNTAFRQPTS
jgi:hypothetical protein